MPERESIPGFELVKDLADLDRRLAEKVAEAHRAADQQIKDAAAESERLLAEAEDQIRRLEEEARQQRAEEAARVAEAARTRAEEEKAALRSQALPNLPQRRGIHSLQGPAVIARMEKLYIVGAKKWAPTVLFKLQQAGVVQIDELPRDELQAYRLAADEASRLRQWEQAATAADHASGLMGLETDAAVATFPGDPEEALARATSFEQRAAALVEKREKLNDELQLIDQYKEVVVYLAESLHGLDNSPRLAVMPFLVERQEDLARSAAELNAALADRYLLVAGPAGRLVAAVLITLKRDAEAARGILAHEGWRELPRVGEYARMDLTGMAARLTARSQSVPRELTALSEAMERLRHEAGPPLQSLRLRAADEVSRLHTLSAMGSGRYGFALCGWVPVSLKPRVTEVLDRLQDQVLYTFEPAQEHHEPERIPVMLENPAWVRPFEALIAFLHTPALR